MQQPLPPTSIKAGLSCNGFSVDAMRPARADFVALVAILLFTVESFSRVIPNQPELEIGDKYPGCFFPLTAKNSGDTPTPLILNSTQKTPIYPDIGQDDVWVAAGEEIRIFCPGKGNSVIAKSTGAGNQSDVIAKNTGAGNQSDVMPAQCTSSGKIYTDTGLIDAPEVACKRPPRSRAKQSGNNCGQNNTEVIIGFPYSSSFVSTFTTCFDNERKEALYAKHTITSSIKTAAKGVSRLSFDPANFYDDIPVNDLYKQTVQLETLAKILNSTELAERYIKPNSAKKFLARGHLAPKADFIYAPEQRATFYYVNVAPQWMSFNAGNWNSLETAVRNLVGQLGRDLDVYTGTYGISTLPDVDGEQQELYLYVDENDNKAVPVPKVFWKLIYDRSTKAGVVVVGVNNPYVSPVPKDYFICERDVCAKLGWLNIDTHKINKGYVYCCEVDDFRGYVDYLPNIPVESLLM